MADPIIPGDVVALKSGGPHMTVTKRDGSRHLCEWFDEKRNHQSQYFEEIVLRPADPN